jgi:hypothetical protein
VSTSGLLCGPIIAYRVELKKLLAEPSYLGEKQKEIFDLRVKVVDQLIADPEMDAVWEALVNAGKSCTPIMDFFEWVMSGLYHASRFPMNHKAERQKLLNDVVGTATRLRELLEMSDLNRRKYLLPDFLVDCASEGVDAASVLQAITERASSQLKLFPLSSKKSKGDYQRSIVFQRYLYAHLSLSQITPTHEIVARTTASLHAYLYKAGTYEGITSESVRGATRVMTDDDCRRWVTNAH